MVERAIPSAVLDERLKALDAEIQRLTIERDLLRGLLQRAVPMSHDAKAGPRPPVASQPDFLSNPPATLTDTVAEYVRNHPGLSSVEVVDGVMADFEREGRAIGGSDPRKTLLTTLGNLVRKDRVRRDVESKHYPGT